MKFFLVYPFHFNHFLAGPSAAGNSDVSPRYAERLAHDTADRFVRLPKLRGRPYPHLKRPIVPPGNSIFTRTGRYSNGNAAISLLLHAWAYHSRRHAGHARTPV